MNQPEFMMPVPADHAAMQIAVEAMRQTAAAMERQAEIQTDLLTDMRADMKEKHLLLHDVHERVIRIEATVTETRIERLEKDVDDLKRDRDKRDGATSALMSLWKNTPSIAAVVVGVALVAFLVLRASGKI